MNKVSSILFFIFLCVLFTGCIKHESFVNYREGVLENGTTLSVSEYEPHKIGPGDILSITLSSIETESVGLFNSYSPGGYEVKKDGTIGFALVGDVPVEGRTLDEAQVILMEKVDKYFIKKPIMSVKLTNFKVTITGAVSGPTSISVPTGKINIIEAITQVGDLTPYAQRDSVMIIREGTGDQKEVGYVNFMSKDIFNSPYFYLKQNDIIYAKPNKNIVATVSGRENKIIPFVSLGISVILLAVNLSRRR